MYELPRVDIFDGLEDLVDDVFLVDLLEDACPDDGVEVCFHEVEYHVEVFVIFCFDDVLELDDVFMPVQLVEELHFPECSLSICCVMKGIENLLQSDDLLGLLVLCLPDDAVGAFPELLNDFILPQDMRLYLLAHGFNRNVGFG